MTIEGLGDVDVVDVIKVGKCVLHQISKEVPDDVDLVGKKVTGLVDLARRMQLQAHHTGTHIIFASCRRVLGPHIWQAGAKKSTE
jgi:alanyl-tRNA synthetase